MEPLILYSINSRLAYNINTKYYHKHYVWCATKFNTNDLDALSRNNPASSNPIEIFKKYMSAINEKQNDKHFDASYLIERINGIKLGLETNKDLIGEETYQELRAEIDNQIKTDQIWGSLEPVIYIIPYSLVKDRVKRAPPSKTASLLSDEYIIEDLRDNEFDVIINLGGKLQ